jgi:hypothetical protein
MADYVIQINQFTDGVTGHVNMTFSQPEMNSVTFGANISPGSGVQIENNAGRQPANVVEIAVTKDQFDAVYNFARTADALNDSYWGLCNNCVDFAKEGLSKIGVNLTSLLLPGTLTRTYAEASDYICDSPYVDIATSALIDILSSPENTQAASQFVEQMSWLADHDVGSDFYNDVANYRYGLDPDFEADTRFALLVQLGKKLGISVKKDPIAERVMLGIASPIIIDMNGDGINTKKFSENSVFFDVNGDGVKDRTAWSDGTDGFLCVDKNHNGLVDSVDEMFGGLKRGEGYAKLATFDTNFDAMVSQDDVGFGDLVIWIDKNTDGVTDAGELTSLSSAGVESVSVNYSSQSVYQNYNLIGEVSDALVNGENRSAADVYFKYESGATVCIEAKLHALISAMSEFSPEASSSTVYVDASTSGGVGVIATSV